MARQWAQVPAYVEYLDRTLGPGSLEPLMDDFAAVAAEMQGHARTMFQRWMDVAVGVPR